MASGEAVTQALQPALTEVTTTAAAATGPLEELALGLIILVVVIAVHGSGVNLVSGRFARVFARLGHGTPKWRLSLLTTASVAGLTVAHLVETLIWALPIWGMGMLASLRDTYFFVLESYTTLGSGDVTLPDQWRLIGPMIAISGLFTFGWTSSVLVYIVGETRHRQLQEERARRGRPPSPDA